MRAFIPHLLTIVLPALAASRANAQSATRELPDTFVPPGATMTVSIVVTPPGGVVVFGAEDRPPEGWSVSNISHSGTFDLPSGKVKWGPFFAPSIPTALSYDVLPPGEAGGANCFAGTASFDGLDQTIGGDLCIQAIPTASQWTLLSFALLLSIAATIRLGRAHLLTTVSNPSSTSH